jgi:MFS family permease
VTAAIIAIAAGAILVPLNSTMLSVALPAIMADFSVTASAVSWLVTAYLATVAVAMTVSGNAGDRLGHRRMFLAGVAGFAVSSLLGALAWSFPVLVLSRVLQAVSGASITTNSLGLIRWLSPEDRRGASFGMFEMLILTSAAAGPFIGGLLTSVFGWRSLFMIAVPVATFSALLFKAMIPLQERTAEVPPLDLGALLRHSLDLFRIRAFASAVAAVFGSTVILHTSMILIPIFTQSLLRASAAVSGVVLFVYFGTSALISPMGGRLSDSAGRRFPAVAGMICMAVGLAGLWRWAGAIAIPQVAGLLALMGLGSGLSGTPRQTSAIESVPPSATGMAAGTYFTIRYLGGVVGASLAGVMLNDGVSTPAVAAGFGLLALVACAVAVVSTGLTGRPTFSPSRP